MSIIKLLNIKKNYGSGECLTEALKDINLQIDEGEMLCIMGPSGSGKSTLLNIIGCIDMATEGQYFLEDENVSSFNGKQLASVRNKKLGFIFQSFNLLNDYDLIDNVTLPLIYNKSYKGNMKEEATVILEKLGLGKHIKKTPLQLSGGQQQRVAIARALIGHPSVILADEPTGSLDQKNGKEIMNILRGINEEGKTVIIITHDPNIAAQCSRKIILEDGMILK